MSTATDQGPFEGQVLTAAELGRVHHGWLLDYDAPPSQDSVLPGPRKRTVTLIGIRQWTYQGRDRVGLLADTDRPFRGEEHIVPADTQVRLQRLIRRGVPRPRKSDYPATQPEETR